jgi:hypothetical protein
MYGLGSTPPRSSCVAAVSPLGVWGLHPVGPWFIPNEITLPATAT